MTLRLNTNAKSLLMALFLTLTSLALMACEQGRSHGGGWGDR